MLGRDEASPQMMCPKLGEGIGAKADTQGEAIVLKGLDIMDTQTLIIIILLVLLLGGGGWYGRGRWF
jgi:hypothetical protein